MQAIFQSGQLVTTAVTANQIILTYTVPANRNFCFNYLSFFGKLTVLPGNSNPIALGEISVEFPAGTKRYTTCLVAPTAARIDLSLSSNTLDDIAAGQVIQIVCTPATATSMKWFVNFGGFLQ